MNIERVRIDKNGRYYVERFSRDGYIKRDFGIIKVCKECMISFFSRNDKVGEYCSNKCQTHLSNHPQWKGGKHISEYSYTQNIEKSKPLVRTHRQVMETHIGRKLNRNEVVHHIDGNKKNNDISNLKLMTLSEHTRLHYILKKTGGLLNDKLFHSTEISA